MPQLTRSRLAPVRLMVGCSLAVMALLTACGGDDSEADSAATTVTAAAVGEDTGTSTDSTGPTENTADSAPAGDRDEFCDAYDELDAATDGMANETIEDMREGAAQLQEAVSAAEAEVPDEIADEFGVLAGSIEDLSNLADDADTIEQFRADVEAYDETEVNPAGEAVDEWYATNC